MTVIGDVRPDLVAQRRWPASLHLELAARGGVTRLVGRRQRGPLALQRTLYPEGGVAHLYLLHPPGGVVGGDTLDIRVRAADAAQCLLTTPGATRFYRGNGVPAVQSHELLLDDAVLEWLPQENIFFDGADATLSTRIEIGGGGRLLAWEMNCFGRPASGERFCSGRTSSEIRVTTAGRPVLVERFRLWPSRGRGDGAAGLRGYPVQAALLAWPAGRDALDAARAAVAGVDFPCAATLLDSLLVLRVLGVDAQSVRAALAAAWSRLRPMIAGHDTLTPRIWQT